MKKIGMLGGLAAGCLTAAAGAGEPLTREACVRAALEASPVLTAANRQADAADAAARQTRSAFWPRAMAGVGYARTDNPPQAFMQQLNQRALDMRAPEFDPNRPDDSGNLRLSAGLTWTLLDGGRARLDRAMARHGASAASAGAEAARNTLVHDVTRAFYGALQARAFVSVQDDQVRSLEESLRVARERLAAGSAVRSDVLNLEVRLAQAREDLIRARNAVRLAVAGLNAAIGRDLASPDNLVPDERAELPALPAAEDASLSRPELRAAERLEAARRAGFERARREFRPTLRAFGEADWDGADTGDLEASYLAGVQVDWEIFDAGRRRAAVQEAGARWAQARAETEQARRGLLLERQQARIGAEEARERIDVTRQSAESAAEALRMTRQRYEQGAADVTELLTAEAGLTAQRTRRIVAYYEYLIAVSNLDRAEGRAALPDANPQMRNHDA